MNINIEQFKADIRRDEQQRAQLQMDVEGLNEEMNRQSENEHRQSQKQTPFTGESEIQDIDR
jgi:hypothetical protein